MSYTAEQLQAMGATPGKSSGFSQDELLSMGATPDSPTMPLAPEKKQYTTGEKFAEVGKGILKGAGSTLTEMSRVGTAVANQTAGRVVNAIEGNGFKPLSNEQLGNDLGNPDSEISKTVDNILESKNGYQTTGKGLEMAAEFLVPGRAAKTIVDARKLAAAPGKILEILTPKLTPTKYAAAGRLGQTVPQTMLKGAELSGAKFPDAQRATDAVLNVGKSLNISPTKILNLKGSATENLNKIHALIGDYSNKIISPFLKTNPVETNFENFIDYMKNVKPTQAIQASKEAASTFNRVRERVIGTVYNSVKSQSKKAGEFGANTDMNVYWNARKTIDNIIEEELGAKTLADPARTGVKAAAQDLRRGVADFISDTLRYPGQGEKVAIYRNTVNGMREKGIEMGPEELKGLAQQLGLNPTGEAVASHWDEMMKNASGLYKGLENISTKISDERKVGKVGQFVKDHPLIIKGATKAAEGAALTAGGLGVYNFFK